MSDELTLEDINIGIEYVNDEPDGIGKVEKSGQLRLSSKFGRLYNWEPGTTLAVYVSTNSDALIIKKLEE